MITSHHGDVIAGYGRESKDLSNQKDTVAQEPAQVYSLKQELEKGF